MSNPTSPRSNSTQATQEASPLRQPVGAVNTDHTPMSGNTNIAGTNLVSLNASSQIPFKLTKDGINYASWKSQMTNLLFGYDLLKFVDGSHPCPLSSDPGYSMWLRQDRLILLAIQATVHNAIGPTINNCQTSAEAWDKLRASYANYSSTRVLTLLTSLMRTTKEGLSVCRIHD